MRPIVTDRVAWSVGLSVTVVSPAKTAQPIEMPFGLRTGIGPRNHCITRGSDPPLEGAITRGKGQLYKALVHSYIEYCVSVRSTYYDNYKKLRERLKHRFARMIPG